MRWFALSLLLLAGSSTLPGQTVFLDFTTKPKLQEVALLDAQGNQTIPGEVEPHHLTSMAVPFVGLKVKVWFELPKDTPTVQPTRIVLGKVNPDKSGGVRLASLVSEDGKAYLKGRIRMAMRIDDECEPYPEAERPKATQNAEGLWILDLPRPLPPGLYTLVSATGGVSMFGGPKVNAKARIFRVGEAPTAKTGAAAPAGTPTVTAPPTVATPPTGTTPPATPAPAQPQSQPATGL
ncbi:hypothetical protein [Geothrix fuzhouensis]|uniref:hypothetical protein n=1 Tax=Geothrix fuzhouensis TaxID=2966451 RepID=UPI0021496055|nr:hypothetical protein [Geothrix fuzhouensis]